MSSLSENGGAKRRMDVETTASDKAGVGGIVESILRKFRVLSHLAMLVPLYALGCIIVGLAAVPGVYLFRLIWRFSQSFPFFAKLWILGFGVSASYLAYGFTLILVVPLANFLLRSKLVPWRGPYYSLDSVRWYIHNGSTYLVRYTFLEFITPTPFNLLFFRLMGMKIGQDSQINSSHISDPSLIEIGNKSTIGGSVTLVGHYGQGGFLVLAPVKIGDRVTIGLKATVMGGVTIGNGVKILPNSVVMPKTVIPDGETWGGVPAQKIAGKSEPKAS